MAHPLGDSFIFGRPRAQPMAQPIGDSFIIGGRGRNLWHNQWEAVLFSAAEGATDGATNGRSFSSWRPRAQHMAHPMAEGATQGATYAHPGGGGADGDDDEHRHRDDTRGDDDHTDVAQIGWTSNCVRGYARFMLAVWAGRGAQAASCLVIWFHRTTSE